MSFINYVTDYLSNPDFKSIPFNYKAIKAQSLHDLTEINEFGDTALCMAVRFNHTELANHLIDTNAGISKYCGDGDFMPIHIATSKENFELVKRLSNLESGIRSKTKDTNQNVVHISAQFNQGYEIITYLLEEKKMDINSQSVDGITPLVLSIVGRQTSDPYKIEMVKFLLNNGADANILYESNLPIDMIVLNDEVELLNELVTCENDQLINKIGNIDIYSINGIENNPANYAAMYSKTENNSVLNVLIRCGIDLNFLYNGRAPIHLAAEYNNNSLKTLIANGANINLQDADGKTPLIKAVENNQFDNLMLLLSHHADVNIQDYSGKSVYDYSSQEARNIIDSHLGLTGEPAGHDQSEL